MTINEALLSVDTRQWIPDEVAVAVYRKSRAYAAKKRCRPETAEDFAAWAITKVIEGRPPVSKWLFADFMRETIGRPGEPSFEVKSALNAAEPLDWCPEPRVPSDQENEYLDIMRSEAFQNVLQVKDAGLVVAHFFYGVSQKQIGDSLGLTESRICQRIKGALRRMNEALQGRIVKLAEDGFTAERIARSLNEVELADEPITVQEVEDIVAAKPKKPRGPTTPVSVEGFVIEKAVPIPTSRAKEKSPLRQFMAGMEIGDSFAAPHDVAKRAAGVAKALNFKISVRRTDDATARIWRTA